MKKYFFSPIYFLLGFITIAHAATAPLQPSSGPGGSAYAHARVEKMTIGEGVRRYFLYKPADPVPAQAPVIVFFHGWGGVNPRTYGAWIDHLVRRGNIVIYPVYQDSLRTPVSDFAPNAIAALQDAFQKLRTDDAHADLARVAYVGHSMGGLLAPSVAALAYENGLPAPRAVMDIEPGKTWARSKRAAFVLPDLSKISRGTWLISAFGETDRLCRDTDARRIYQESTSINTSDKLLLRLMSDAYGDPALVADHMAPTAPNMAYDTGDSLRDDAVEVSGKNIRSKIRERVKERLAERKQKKLSDSELSDLGPMKNGEDTKTLRVDAMDFYGTWKVFDFLYEGAFSGDIHLPELRSDPAFLSMGTWSDGTPVKPLEIVEAGH